MLITVIRKKQRDGMGKKAAPKRPLKHIRSLLEDSPLIWIGSARQFKKLEELNRPKIEEERANRDYVRWEKMPIPLDGFDVFLLGVAIENLLKGVLRVKGRSFKQVVSEGHELASLYTKCCNLCQLAPNNDECRALEKLEQFVVWVGKYNLPIGDLDKIIQKLASKQEITLTALSSPCGPIITLDITELERKSMLAVYERFLNYLTMGYTSQLDSEMRKCPQ